jgi:hypothetical protein
MLNRLVRRKLPLITTKKKRLVKQLKLMRKEGSQKKRSVKLPDSKRCKKKQLTLIQKSTLSGLRVLLKKASDKNVVKINFPKKSC